MIDVDIQMTETNTKLITQNEFFNLRAYSIESTYLLLFISSCFYFYSQ